MSFLATSDVTTVVVVIAAVVVVIIVVVVSVVVSDHLTQKFMQEKKPKGSEVGSWEERSE